MVGGLGTYFAHRHEFAARDTEWVFALVGHPDLKQGHVEADMCSVESWVVRNFIIEIAQMFDRIHRPEDFVCTC